MKIEELLKIVDSGVVEEITIFYCGGRIKIEPNHAPFELPDYNICKLWNSENGRGISILLADGIAAEREPAPDNLATESANAETAEKAADTLRKYCNGFVGCSKSCVFYNKDKYDCRVNYPEDYKNKDGTS